MRIGFLVLTLLTCPLLWGCGAQVSREELGEVEFEVPKVPGSTLPYQLPDFSQPYENQAQAAPADRPAG